MLPHWTTAKTIATIANMDAELLRRFKSRTPEGWIIEYTIWRIPEPVPPCTHRFKYSAVLIIDGERVLGFDNERGKGDHRHIGGEERAYTFRGFNQLIHDLIDEAKRWRAEH